jgi:nitrogen fixation protein NifB
VLEKIPNIAVTGIAGPGDPFALPDATMETLRLVRARYPDMLLCVSTNGLGLPPYVRDLAALKVSHVTVTVNAVNPVIGMKIYEWVREPPRIHRGLTGARVLFERQEESVKALKAAGVTVKINTVVVPGINDKHAEEVAVWAAKAGADIHNFIPVLPVPGTLFEGAASPSPQVMAEIRLRAGKYLPQMSHCGRCRADAAGLLGADNAAIIQQLLREAGGVVADDGNHTDGASPEEKIRIAVASGDGISVNRHLGRADCFYIYGKGVDGGKPELVEIREAPPADTENRWAVLAETLHDCFAVLAAASGLPPKRVLAGAGITVCDGEGTIAGQVTPLFERKMPFSDGFRPEPRDCPRSCGSGPPCGTSPGCGLSSNGGCG